MRIAKAKVQRPERPSAGCAVALHRLEVPSDVFVSAFRQGDDGEALPRPILAEVTTLLARSLRGDDWLASSGPTEFVIVMAGPALGARAAADRLSAAIADLAVPGLSAAAGLATLTPDLTAGEALRRATVSLTAARRVGPGTVVQHRLPY